MNFFYIIILIFISNWNVQAADATRPAQINLNSFSKEKLSLALTQCGIKLLGTIKHIPICNGNRCQGGYDSNHSITESEISDNITEFTWGLGFNNKYDSHHSYDGTSYSFLLWAKLKEPGPSPLWVYFSDHYSDDGRGISQSDKIPLVSDGNMPLFSFTQTVTHHCHFDEFGRRICGPKSVQYSQPTWILGNSFKEIVPWRNSETGIILDRFVNFGYFMTCVESEF